MPQRQILHEQVEAVDETHLDASTPVTELLEHCAPCQGLFTGGLCRIRFSRPTAGLTLTSVPAVRTHQLGRFNLTSLSITHSQQCGSREGCDETGQD